MSSTINRSLDPQDPEDGSAGVARSEPPRGRAQRRAGAAREPDPDARLGDRVKNLLPDSVIDELLAGAGSEEEMTAPGVSLAKSSHERGAAQ